MFDVSWGETFIIIGVSMFLIGRKDLPAAARFVGTQTGRVVGLLQGARVRADRFAAQSELRQLQNELRSGLRELDAVRSEMAVAVSSQGIVGRTLGSTLPGTDRSQPYNNNNNVNTTTNNNIMTQPPIQHHLSASAVGGTTLSSTPTPQVISQVRELAPRSHAVAAVAEEEWQKRGIGFQSRAERGMGDATGSALLSNLYQQTLIHDQHDRVIREQDDALRSRIEQKQSEMKES